MNKNERIKKLRQLRGLSVKEFAQNIGVAPSTIYMYESGEREPSNEVWENIADYFNVDMDYLLCRSDIPNRTLEYRYSETIISNKNEITVPIVGEVACGLPIFAEQNVIGYASVDKKDNIDFALYAKGDSMNAAKIDDGDLVYIRQQSAVDNGEIALVLVDNDTATIKRFYDYGEIVVLRPDSNNAEHREQVYKKKDTNIVIQGKVIFIKSYIN